jgi:hypothetical protein
MTGALHGWHGIATRLFLNGQDWHLTSFPSPISRPNPASLPRTPAIKGSNGVQLPRLGFSYKYFELANRIPSLLRSSPWPRDREPRRARRSDVHEEASVKTGARRSRDFPDIQWASSATAERDQGVCAFCGASLFL